MEVYSRSLRALEVNTPGISGYVKAKLGVRAGFHFDVCWAGEDDCALAVRKNGTRCGGYRSVRRGGVPCVRRYPLLVYYVRKPHHKRSILGKAFLSVSILAPAKLIASMTKTGLNVHVLAPYGT